VRPALVRGLCEPRVLFLRLDQNHRERHTSNQQSDEEGSDPDDFAQFIARFAPHLSFPKACRRHNGRPLATPLSCALNRGALVRQALARMGSQRLDRDDNDARGRPGQLSLTRRGLHLAAMASRASPLKLARLSLEPAPVAKLADQYVTRAAPLLRTAKTKVQALQLHRLFRKTWVS
jgi:hypothetical protein